MPETRDLVPYPRGAIWWVKGHRPDTGDYIRESLGTRDEAIADAKVEEIYREARKRRLLGPDAPKPEDELIFAAASELYEPTPRDARYLVPILKRDGKTRVRDMTPAYVRKMARELYPMASTDTWQRQVITPVRSVINNAHELGKCPPIRIKAFDREERLKQDRFRGKESRVPKTPGSWPWLRAFMAHADPRDAALAYFMFTKGARLGQSTEMLRDGDMDLPANRLRVPAAKGHEAQWVKIDPELVAMISNLPRPRNREAWRLVFYTAAGHASAVYRRWRTACKRAGIEYIPPHAEGRHGFGTEMIVRQGLNPVDVAKAGRWASPVVPLRTYAHPEGSEAKIDAAMRIGKEASRTPGVQGKIAGQAKRLRGNGKP